MFEVGDSFYLDDHLPRKQTVVVAAVVVVVVVVQPGPERWNSTRLMSRQKECVKITKNTETLTKVRLLNKAPAHITRFNHCGFKRSNVSTSPKNTL